jgi:limonene-1,2-epoxide hydrolase
MAGSNEEVLRAVLASWGEGLEAAAAATREHFADDCVWEQTAIPTTTGPEEAAQLMLGMEAMGFKAIEVDYRNVVSSGDVVCTERVDHILGLDGTRKGSFPVVGVTEFRDGKISSWREYFDSANLAQLA